MNALYPVSVYEFNLSYPGVNLRYRPGLYSDNLYCYEYSFFKDGELTIASKAYERQLDRYALESLIVDDVRRLLLT